MAGIEACREEPALPSSSSGAPERRIQALLPPSIGSALRRSTSCEWQGIPIASNAGSAAAQLPIAIREGASVLDSVILSAGEAQAVLDASL